MQLRQESQFPERKKFEREGSCAYALSLARQLNPETWAWDIRARGLCTRKGFMAGGAIFNILAN